MCFYHVKRSYKFPWSQINFSDAIKKRKIQHTHALVNVRKDEEKFIMHSNFFCYQWCNIIAKGNLFIFVHEIGLEIFYDYVICPMLHFFQILHNKTFFLSVAVDSDCERKIIVQTRGFSKLQTKLLLRFQFLWLWELKLLCVWFECLK